MHNHQIRSGAETFNVNVNGDFSGDAWIDVPIERIEAEDDWGRRCVKIPMNVIRELVGRQILDERVSRLEQLSGEEVLGL